MLSWVLGRRKPQGATELSEADTRDVLKSYGFTDYPEEERLADLRDHYQQNPEGFVESRRRMIERIQGEIDYVTGHD